MHGTYTVTVGQRIGMGIDFVTLQAPPLTVEVGMPGFGLSAQIQRLALTDEPDRREAVLTGVGQTLQRGIGVVKASARDDESQQVRQAAQRVLTELHAATADGSDANGAPAPGP